MGFTLDHQGGARARLLSLSATAILGSSPPPLGTKNGLLMPELMLTKARWNKKSPAPQYQHPISSQHSLPSRTSSRTFQESLVALQRGWLSFASPGHLWVCPGPPQHRMALCHPLVAGRLAVALRWPHPGPLVQGRQGSAFSILLIPASLLWPFAPRDYGGYQPPEDRLSQLSCPMSQESPRQFQVQGRASLKQDIPAHPMLPASHGKCLRVIQIRLL